LIINCYENRQDNNIMNNSNLIFGLIIMHKFLTLLVNVVWMNWFLYSLVINFEMIECTSTVTGWETIKLHLTNKKSCRLMIWWKFYVQQSSFECKFLVVLDIFQEISNSLDVNIFCQNYFQWFPILNALLKWRWLLMIGFNMNK